MSVPQWARSLLRTSNAVIIDTETTGLEEDAKIVSMAIIKLNGEGDKGILFNSLINPLAEIPASATAIHGIDNSHVSESPSFAEFFPEIRAALINKEWVIYNQSFDLPRIAYECKRAGLLMPPYAGVHCVMEEYARFWGDWNDYHQSYKWQSLSNAMKQQGLKIVDAHNALADAMMTRNLIKHLARQGE